MNGRSQVVIDMKLIQVAHTSNRNTGTQFPQSISAFNVSAEEQSLLNANQSLVQQIISSGLASPNDPLAILGILIASGQVSSPLLSSGFALFGGGLTESALAPGTTTFNLNLNTSDSRELDDIQLRLQDGQEGTFKEGERYPIQTSSYSSLSPNLPSLAGLDGRGNLKQPHFAALLAGHVHAEHSHGAVSGSGPDAERQRPRCCATTLSR